MNKGLISYYIFLGVFIAFVLVLGILPYIFPFLSMEPAVRYEYRYESFVSLLNEEEKKLFFERNYSECAKLIDRRVREDTSFSNKLAQIKEFEVIDTFDTSTMLEYFGYYVYNELLKYNSNYSYDK